MFQKIIDILDQEGSGLYGFNKCAEVAVQCGLDHPDAAGPFLLLSFAANRFASRCEDGQALDPAVAEKEYSLFKSYISRFEKAYTQPDKDQQLVTLNAIAVEILKNR
jgi:hypothetical protein